MNENTNWNARHQRALDWLVGLELHDCCSTHCRDWSETQGGRLPPSQHSPGCPNYKQKRYQRVTVDGSGFVDSPENVAEFLAAEEDPEQYKVEDIYMTSDQFERLEEFTGF